MMADFLDTGLVDAFCSGDRRGENELAGQVARLLPFRGSLPNRTVEALTRLVRCLGGEERLLPWLGEHPGVPQVVAAVYALVGLLDRIGDDPGVADALPEIVRNGGLPALLEAHLVPAPVDARTSRETLASLGGQLELMLGEERFTDAVQLAAATVDLLRAVGGPDDLRRVLDAIRADLEAVMVTGT
ncbi:hypothetical protein [Dactylosporangium matsuzakiense]|nr:hypothetical protein [Dactylosporangium matsuzakiense]